MVDISVIIPVFNEEDNILPLAIELAQAFAVNNWTWECIWIDDGSTDQTPLKIDHMARSDGRHRYLIFATHTGMSAACHAGFEAARGSIICTLDGDGQNDPADLPLFITMLQSENADMIAGYREIRHDKWLKRVASFIGNAFWNMITGQKLKDTACSTRVMKKSPLMTIPFFSGMHRFFPTLFLMMGYRIIEAPSRHRPRLKGRSKYGIWNRLGLWLVDCCGVMWLRKRILKYKVIKRSE